MRYHFYLCLSLFCVWFVMGERSIAKASDTVMSAQLTELIEQQNLVGITWATVNANSVQQGSAGWANISEQKPMHKDQKVHVGSVTKTLLALGVLRLISDGKLSLDTDVEQLLPHLKFNNTWSMTSPVRVRHLLNHTAGLDNIRIWQLLNTRVFPDTPLHHSFPTEHEFLLTIRTLPGAQYSYSNMGYTLLGMVIEAITSLRYEDYLQQALLEPLGMHDSTFEFISQRGLYADDRLAMGYLEGEKPQPAVPTYLRPATQFSTTAADMIKVAQLIISTGKIAKQRFIKPELMQMLGYPDATDAAKAGLKIGHGLALAVRDRHGVIGLCHPGTTFGFRAYFCVFPEQQKAFFYSINTDSETADYEQFNAWFIEQLHVEKQTKRQVDGSEIIPADISGLYQLSPGNMEEFTWLDMMFNALWLSVDNEAVYLHSLQRDTRRLIPGGENLFRASDRASPSHVFMYDTAKQWEMSDGLKTYKKQGVVIYAAHWISLICGLLGVVYVLLVGVGRVVKYRFTKDNYVAWPACNILALALPICLYSHQSFLQFGEPSVANYLLYMFTAMLPITLFISLYKVLRGKACSRKRDAVAIFTVLQMSLVLVYWQVFPVAFWF